MPESPSARGDFGGVKRNRERDFGEVNVLNPAELLREMANLPFVNCKSPQHIMILISPGIRISRLVDIKYVHSIWTPGLTRASHTMASCG